MRPKCIARLTVRLPEELLQDIKAAAIRRCCSESEIVINSLENDLGRLALYHISYYDDMRPLILRLQQESCQTMADTRARS